MDKKYITSQLEQLDFQILPLNYAGFDFDIVATTKKVGDGHHFLIKFIDNLDGVSIEKWKEKFDIIFKKTKGLFLAKPFILILVVKVATPSSIALLLKHRKVNGNSLSHIVIADLETATIHGNPPVFPLVGREINEKVIAVISDAIYLNK